MYSTSCFPADPCDPNPCQNSGSCSVYGSSSSCACASGFTGSNCSDISTATTSVSGASGASGMHFSNKRYRNILLVQCSPFSHGYSNHKRSGSLHKQFLFLNLNNSLLFLAENGV